MRSFCGPYFICTADSTWITEPFTEVDQPLESAWAAAVIKRWRRRLAKRRKTAE